MFRRKSTRADPSLVDSLTLLFGCSFVHSFIRSVSQYIIHVFIHSCCIHRLKLTRADPSLVDSLALLFGCSFVHSFIRSVSQYIIHVLIIPAAWTGGNLLALSISRSLARLFGRSFIHPFIYSVSQSVRVYHSRIYLFVCSFFRSFIHSFLPSVSQSPETKRPPRDKGLLTKLVQSRWLYFFRRVGLGAGGGRRLLWPICSYLDLTLGH